MWRGAHLHLEAGIKVEEVALALSLAGNSACRPGFSPRWSQDCTDRGKETCDWQGGSTRWCLLGKQTEK